VTLYAINQPSDVPHRRHAFYAPGIFLAQFVLHLYMTPSNHEPDESDKYLTCYNENQKRSGNFT